MKRLCERKYWVDLKQINMDKCLQNDFKKAETFNVEDFGPKEWRKA